MVRKYYISDVESHCPFICSNDAPSQILSSDESKIDAEMKMENGSLEKAHETHDVPRQPIVLLNHNKMVYRQAVAHTSEVSKIDAEMKMENHVTYSVESSGSLEKAHETHDVSRQPILLRNHNKMVYRQTVAYTSKIDAEMKMENHITYSVESIGSLEKAHETHDVSRQPILLRNLTRWSTDKL